MEKHAALAARELHEACNLRKRGVDADAFDGPLAWRVAKKLLERDSSDHVFCNGVYCPEHLPYNYG